VSSYHLCDSCGFGFFDYRYSGDEMDLIYKNYRGKNYTKIRSAWEPWYTDIYNDGHYLDKFVVRRREVIEQFLKRNNLSTAKTIVDVGGDSGQFIPVLNSEKRFVFDPSDKAMVEGVTRIDSLNSVDVIDLIIYAHVLEHVADPISELSKLLERASCIYIEVPVGVPVINRLRRNKIRFIFRLAESLSKYRWAKSSHPSATRIVKPKSTLTQSEHLNFFSMKSLEVIASRLNVQFIAEEDFIHTPDLSEGQVLQCLLRK
jgi:2-polyprenyl-3-methyl-5-hydroxy-6-metoxy-1,4-benzoquinol methylase